MTVATKIRLLVAALCSLATAVVLVALISSSLAPSSQAWTAAAVLGCAVALTTNFEVESRGVFTISGAAMVVVASFVVFREYDFLLAMVIIALCNAASVVQIRKREYQKLLFNGAAQILSLLAGASVYWQLSPDQALSHVAAVLVAAGTAALVALVVNSALVALPVALTSGEKYRDLLREFVALDIGGLPFALLGVGLGWVYLEFGAFIVPLFVVPTLIARTAFASYLEVKASQEQTIETLIHALEAKDHYTAGHAQRVAQFSEYVGEEFHFGARRMERLRYAALMHDIGKLIVPNQILNKPGRLTEAEYERVRRHEPVSVELLGRIDFLAPVAGDTTTEAATAAVDGAGLIEPAIIHVADAFDAMTSTRSYRRALTQATAFEELRAGAGTQFNERCVVALIAAIEQRGEHYGAGHEIDEHEWAVAPPEAGTGSAGLGHLVAEEQGTA